MNLVRTSLVMGVGFLLAGIWVVGSADAQGPVFKFCAYAHEPEHWWKTGHVFAQLFTTNPAAPDRDKTNLVYGHYPGGWKMFGGGPHKRIRDNSLTSWSWKICYDLTLASFNAAAGSIRADQANPPAFNLITHNCVDWAKEKAAAAGVPMLPSSTNFLGIDSPRAFRNTLVGIGDGNTFGAPPAPVGTVKKNPNPAMAPGGADPPPFVYPDQCDYDGLEEFGMTSSAPLAAALHLESHIEALPEEQLTPGQMFVVTLSNAGLPDAEIVLDWGDTSPRAYQTSSATHSCGSSGRFVATILVVNDGAVNQFTIPITVSATSGDGTATILVPNAPPSQFYEDPFPVECPDDADAVQCPPPAGAGAVPTLSESALLLLAGGLLASGTILIVRNRK